MQVQVAHDYLYVITLDFSRSVNVGAWNVCSLSDKDKTKRLKRSSETGHLLGAQFWRSCKFLPLLQWICYICGKGKIKSSQQWKLHRHPDTNCKLAVSGEELWQPSIRGTAVGVRSSSLASQPLRLLVFTRRFAL